MCRAIREAIGAEFGLFALLPSSHARPCLLKMCRTIGLFLDVEANAMHLLVALPGKTRSSSCAVR